MLKALYDYAEQNRMVLPPGFVNKNIKAYISLSQQGAFLGFILPEDKQGVPCPDIGSLANGTDKCNILAEKRSLVLPDVPNAKSGFFTKTMENGGEYEPMMAVCLKALRDGATFSAIKQSADEHRIKGNDRISFMVDGRSILDSERLVAWWKEFRRQFVGAENTSKVPCLITGELTIPMRTVPPISGLNVVGGHARGDALICFDKPAFCSYNQKQAANAPVSEEAFAGVKAALDSLIADAPSLAGMKFVHWFDRPVEKKNDPTELLFSSFAEEDEEGAEPDEPVETSAEARVKADRLINSVKSGETTPPLANRYYILLLSGVNGRVMIRRWERGSYDVLKESVDQWQADTSIANAAGTGRAKTHKLTPMMIHLLKRQKSDKNVFERMGKELSGITSAVIMAILTGGILPEAVASRALAYIHSQMTDADDDLKSPPIPDEICCQWLKAWLLRWTRIKKEEEDLMADYNPGNRVPAYHCGAIMAVYAAIQKEAMRDVNAGIIQRYYASASRTPALVMGQLNTLSNYHFDKITWKWLAEQFTELLNAAYCALGDNVPVTLNLEQQAYFALGYRQMAVEINRRRNEKEAESKEKKARKEEQKNIEEGK